MTVLVGSSLLLIGASALALLVGWAAAEEALIWTSIVASVGAGVMLALAYTRSRSEGSAARTSTAVPGTSPGPNDSTLLEGAAGSPPGAPRIAAGSGPTGGRMEARSRPVAPVSSPPVRQSKPVLGPADEEVVAVPSRKKFHRPDCRYAKTPGGERMTKAGARARSYAACGICKP